MAKPKPGPEDEWEIVQDRADTPTRRVLRGGGVAWTVLSHLIQFSLTEPPEKDRLQHPV